MTALHGGRGLAVVLPFGALSGPSAGTGGQVAHHGSLIVTTDAGAVGGKNAEGTDQFFGIPYAAPPVGALRWEAPQPVTPWHGVRSAQSCGNLCPQLPSGNGPRSDTEDCLYLNVFTPPGSESGQAARPGAGHLPVLVMIHGGGLVNGSGNRPQPQPARLRVGRGPCHGTGLPVAELQQRVLAV